MNLRMVTLVTAAVLNALTLSGCISVFPATRPVSLYRFEAEAPAESTTTAAEAGVANVLLSQGVFTNEAAGDRMVAVSGGRIAYVAGARWVAPAEVLFDDAMMRTFHTQQGLVRLIRRGDPAFAQYMLRFDVDHFEVRYPADADATPTVVVDCRAVLVRAKDHLVLGETSFEAKAAAETNRVSAFIPAYDRAVGETLNELSTWLAEMVATSA